VKIAWCTPFSRESAIGAVSRAVAEQLAHHCDVEVFHPRTPHPLSTELLTHPLLSGGDDDCASLATYDVVVYCMGDNHALHRSVYEASQRVSGIVVLHDLCLHHFFADLWLQRGDLAGYLGEIERLYGREARELAKRARESGPFWSWRPVHVEQMPMFEPALLGAWGVVTHSEFARSRVAEHFMGPTVALELPLAKECFIGEGGPAPTPRDDRVLLLGIGTVNANKRVDVVLHALASDRDLASRLRYAVVGSADPEERKRLSALVATLGLEDTVELAGRVSDEELDAWIHAADICVNLRSPALEAASASLVDELRHGKPVIVTDTGCYAEIPDHCVAKTNPNDEVPSVATALRRLVDDPTERHRLGASALGHAREHFAAERYAERFLAFVDDALRTRPLLLAADALGAQLRRMGATPDMPITNTVAAVSHDLFAEVPEPSPQAR
jgi:glycosyltransferase involved in cell wall biosynthesis